MARLQIVAAIAAISAVVAIDNGKGMTPPRGWCVFFPPLSLTLVFLRMIYTSRPDNRMLSPNARRPTAHRRLPDTCRRSWNLFGANVNQ